MAILPKEIQVIEKYNGSHSRQASHMLWISGGRGGDDATLTQGILALPGS